MSRFTRKKNGSQRQSAAQAPEDPVVRQYRYLLRTAPADALEAAHAEALPTLPEVHQDRLLATLRDVFLVGDHVSTQDVPKLAHLLTAGERRSPGQLLPALPGEVQQSIAAAVLQAEASFGLLGGYQAWDGQDPQPESEGAWADAGFDPDSGRWNTNRRGHVDNSGYTSGGGGGGVGGDGGG
jgi:hypothetical protein